MRPLLKNWLFRSNRSLIHVCDTALSHFGKSCIVLLFAFAAPLAIAQNLVPNPSFEIHSFCPDTNPYTINYVTQWTGAGTSVDYYNTCATNTAFVVPSQWWGGFQFARTGNAYVGFSVYYYSGPPDRREYLQTTLMDTLINNTCYLVKFYVNLSNTSIWGVNNVAANFSSSTFSDSLEQLVPMPMDVYKYGNPIITDTAVWVEINGIYSADGGEKYMTIGDFKDNDNTDTLTVNTTTFMNGGYYFIDDVSVIPIDSIPGGMPASAGNDMTILGGDSVFIGQEITNLNCNWYIGTALIADSISGIFVSPTATTTYTVEQNLCGTITYDTVTVYISGVGINENNIVNTANLFPNPNAGEFRIESKDLEGADVFVEINDLSGQQVYSQHLQLSSLTNDFKLDISNGVYFVRITNVKDYATIIKKLVIQK